VAANQFKTAGILKAEKIPGQGETEHREGTEESREACGAVSKTSAFLPLEKIHEKYQKGDPIKEVGQNGGSATGVKFR